MSASEAARDRKSRAGSAQARSRAQTRRRPARGGAPRPREGARRGKAGAPRARPRPTEARPVTPGERRNLMNSRHVFAPAAALLLLSSAAFAATSPIRPDLDYGGTDRNGRQVTVSEKPNQ